MRQWLVLLGLALILFGCGGDEEDPRLGILEGTLEETQVELGKTRVELGEIQIELGKAQLELEQAKEGLDKAQLELERVKEGLDKTQLELEEAELELAEAQESVQEAEDLVDKFERLRIVKIVDEQFDVPAARFVPFKFTVPSFEEASVIGDFRGKGNDNLITVMLFEELQYLKWKDGQVANLVFGSGRVMNGKIDVDLEAEGIYYLVFSNLESNFFNREVTSEVSLFYFVPK